MNRAAAELRLRSQNHPTSCYIVIFNLLKPTGYVMHHQFNIQQLYALPHAVFMCFVFIWEQTATCATYSINWLVFITEMKSVYSAVRTGSLNKAVCASNLKGYDCHSGDAMRRLPCATWRRLSHSQVQVLLLLPAFWFQTPWAWVYRFLVWQNDTSGKVTLLYVLIFTSSDRRENKSFWTEGWNSSQLRMIRL